MDSRSSQSDLALTDRDLLVAIFNVICALARELTGKQMIAICPTSEGELRLFGDSVVTIPRAVAHGEAAESVRLPLGSLERHHMPDQPTRELHDTSAAGQPCQAKQATQEVLVP
jgi:hypothetical protein